MTFQTEFDLNNSVKKIILLCFNLLIISVMKFKLKMQERKYFLREEKASRKCVRKKSEIIKINGKMDYINDIHSLPP